MGCCGWSGAQGAYFARFPAIEIQSTFYDPESAKTVARWRASAPEGFQFCMKAWQLITHSPASPTYRRLRAPVKEEEREELGSFRNTEPVWRAWERTRELANLLGATVVVFQCPASFLPSEDNVKSISTFFQRVGPQPFHLAWEPRGPAWPTELIYEICLDYGLVHCVDPFVNKSVHGRIVYWRLHGRGSYFYRYSDGELQDLHRMLDHQREGREAYVMFNNVPMKDDADRFRQILSGAG